MIGDCYIKCLCLTLCMIVCGAAGMGPDRVQSPDTMENDVAIIPQPLEIKRTKGFFPLSDGVFVSYRDAGAENSVAFLKIISGNITDWPFRKDGPLRTALPLP